MEEQRMEEVQAEVEQTDEGRTRLRKDEMWVRDGNNKAWRSPAVEARRKKMAKASKKRNRK